MHITATHFLLVYFFPIRPMVVHTTISLLDNSGQIVMVRNSSVHAYTVSRRYMHTHPSPLVRCKLQSSD